MFETPETRAQDVIRQAVFLAHVLAGTEYAAQADELSDAVKRYAANALAREEMAVRMEGLIHDMAKESKVV